jgi:hypothetical protein
MPEKTIVSICTTHGETDFALENFGTKNERFRCKKCRTEAVHRRRLLVKDKAVKYKGGKCSKCGYNKCNAALDFHHLDPNEKEIQIGSGNTIAWETLKKELDKCILVCSNCHREIHDEEKKQVQYKNYTKTCLICGKEFEDSSACKRKYCSKTCVNKAKNSKRTKLRVNVKARSKK